MYSKTVFTQEQALSKAALATGWGIVLSVCGMARLALLCFALGCGELVQPGWMAHGSHRPVQRLCHRLAP